MYVHYSYKLRCKFRTVNSSQITMSSDAEVNPLQHGVLHPQKALAKLVTHSQQHYLPNFKIMDEILLPSVLQVEMALHCQDILVVLDVLVLCGAEVATCSCRAAMTHG